MNSRALTGIGGLQAARMARPRRIRFLCLLTIVLATCQAGSAGAEVKVTGDSKALQIEAHEASIEDVMAALGANFGLQYRGTATLDRRITGSYRGTLQQVIRRVLDGYDFIMKTNVDDIEVTVLNSKAGEASASAAPPVPTSGIAPPPAPTRAQSARERRQRRQPH
jgi:hypothetical protein